MMSEQEIYPSITQQIVTKNRRKFFEVGAQLVDKILKKTQIIFTGRAVKNEVNQRHARTNEIEGNIPNS